MLIVTTFLFVLDVAGAIYCGLTGHPAFAAGCGGCAALMAVVILGEIHS